MFAPHALPGINPGPEYDDGVNSSVTVAVQIESRSGVENVEKIAAVSGIDVLFIGPFDLAKQMGVARGGKEHESAIQRILTASHAAGKKAAIFCRSNLNVPDHYYAAAEKRLIMIFVHRYGWQRFPCPCETRV